MEMVAAAVVLVAVVAAVVMLTAMAVGVAVPLMGQQQELLPASGRR